MRGEPPASTHQKFISLRLELQASTASILQEQGLWRFQQDLQQYLCLCSDRVDGVEDKQEEDLILDWALQKASLPDYRLVDKKNARRYDDCITYSFVASKKALRQAGLEKGKDDAHDKLDKTKVGVLIGSGMGGLTVFQDNAAALKEKGVKKVSPFFIPYAITNM